MLDAASGKNRDVRCATANIDQSDPQVFFIIAEDRFAGCDLLQDDLVDLQPDAIDGFNNILDGRHGTRDDMNLGLQPDTGHPHGIPDAVLIIHNEILRQGMKDFSVCGNGNGF